MAPASHHLPALPFILESSCYRETSAPLLAWARRALTLSSRAAAEAGCWLLFGVLWFVGWCPQQEPVSSRRRLVYAIRLWKGRKEDTGVRALRAAEGSLLWLFPGAARLGAAPGVGP
ncbi:unnamed protein product [Rangifer tarandus platyrhynchus]|uniref:Uncharacterized protein n=2 Tax=Rangifer tarandus platyrhynchus TaxID=3082113 RepID=A0ACB0EYY5_RANTA|nr:unnamed protein product [Rangifer tarandus platyrhynchus]CAI9705582.1 unnamed protein product [Rangifer tarandus platyrhynchus]